MVVSARRSPNLTQKTGFSPRASPKPREKCLFFFPERENAVNSEQNGKNVTGRRRNGSFWQKPRQNPGAAALFRKKAKNDVFGKQKREKCPRKHQKCRNLRAFSEVVSKNPGIWAIFPAAAPENCERFARRGECNERFSEQATKTGFFWPFLPLAQRSSRRNTEFFVFLFEGLGLKARSCPVFDVFSSPGPRANPRPATFLVNGRQVTGK